MTAYVQVVEEVHLKHSLFKKQEFREAGVQDQDAVLGILVEVFLYNFFP